MVKMKKLSFSVKILVNLYSIQHLVQLFRQREAFNLYGFDPKESQKA